MVDEREGVGRLPSVSLPLTHIAVVTYVYPSQGVWAVLLLQHHWNGMGAPE
jgi:hypothetical protein